MPAGPVGSVWASGSWSDTAWEANTWANALAAPAAFGDLTTLFVHYVEDLHDATPTEPDSNTLVRDDLPNVVAGTVERADRNTQYAEYLS